MATELGYHPDYRERHNEHQTQRKRDQPYASGPAKERTGAIHSALAEKPAAANHEDKQQHHSMHNPYRHRLIDSEHVIENDQRERDDREKKTDFHDTL
jgi:hypothetical protein